jgi:hypothetical protein
MFFSFGKHARERKLIRGLRKKPPVVADAEELSRILANQAARDALPMALLWKALVVSEKALQRLAPDDPLRAVLSNINLTALREVQYREVRKV